MKNLKKLLLPVALLCLITVGCKKDKDNDPTPTPPTTPPFSSTTNPEISYKIDGSSVVYKNEVSNVGQGVSTGASLGTTDVQGNTGAFFYQHIDLNTTRTWFSIDKGTLIWPIGPGLDTTTWKNFFAPGAYTYVANQFGSSSNPQHGVIITIEDSNGSFWSTVNGSKDQTGSKFNIIQSLYYPYWGEKYMKVKITFNCKVYDDAGNMKTLTDGSGVMDFEAPQ